MSDFVLSQVIVAVALLFDQVSIQLSKRQHLIIGQAIAALLIAVHFFILGYDTAGALFAMGCIRLLISLKWRNHAIQIATYSFIVLATVYTYTGYLSILSCAAGLLMAMGAFSNSFKNLRLLFIAGSSTWLIHNTLAWTPVAIAMESLFLAGNLVAYYRFFIRKDKLKAG